MSPFRAKTMVCATNFLQYFGRVPGASLTRRGTRSKPVLRSINPQWRGCEDSPNKQVVASGVPGPGRPGSGRMRISEVVFGVFAGFRHY